MPRRHRSVLIAAAFVCATVALPATARAASVRDHQRITRQALHDAGWTDEELIERVVRCNLGTDLARLNAPYRETLAFLFPKTGKFVDPILGLAATAPFNSHGTNGFHFNNLYSFAAIEKTWRELSDWVDANVQTISLTPGTFSTPTDDPRVLALFGMTMHAAQDFYSHTNWVQLLSPYLPGKAPDAFPLWEDVMEEDSAWLRIHPDFPRQQVLVHLQLSNEFTSKDEKKGGLQSGKARGAPQWEGDPPWGHRHAEGAIDEVIDILSRRASVQWIRRIESSLDKSEGGDSHFPNLSNEGTPE